MCFVAVSNSVFYITTYISICQHFFIFFTIFLYCHFLLDFATTDNMLPLSFTSVKLFYKILYGYFKPLPFYNANGRII